MSEEKPVAKKSTAKKAAVKKPVEEHVEEIIEESSTPDALDVITAKDVVVFMKMGYSYSGPDYEFTSEAPFQRVSPTLAAQLIQTTPERFEIATKEQVQEFYSGGLG